MMGFITNYFTLILFIFLVQFSISSAQEAVNFIKIGRSEFKGVEGALTITDVRALQSLIKLKCNPSNEMFRYAEVGSYLGLSATIVSDSCPNSILYCHDLFPMEEVLSEDSAPPPEPTNMLIKFWDGVLRNHLELNVIPMRGKSEDTFQVHHDESLDFVFVDGDHSYKGAVSDLRLVWPKLKQSGFLLIHDAIIKGDGSNDFVREAVITFSKEISVKFYDIQDTWGMVVMVKGEDNNHEALKGDDFLTWS